MKSHKAIVGLPTYLVRHGKTDYSKLFEDRGLVDVHGQLNELGMDQVTQAGSELIDRFKGLGISKVLLIASHKRRCWQSAEILNTLLGEAGISVQIQINQDFRDVDVLLNCEDRPNGGSYGDWEADLLESQTWMDGWHRDQKYHEGEESPDQLYTRVVAGWERLTRELGDDYGAVILVSHEEVMLPMARHLSLDAGKPTYAEVWEIMPE